MNVSPLFDNLKQRLVDLAEHPNAGRVFGFNYHKGKLLPPLKEEEIQKFEVKHDIVLPNEYRQYIKEISAGGMGPGNGMYFPGTAGLTMDSKPSKKIRSLKTEFPFENDQEKCSSISGILPLCELGCGQYVALVISGPQRGKVWLDARNDWGGMRSESGYTFFEWFTAWLGEAERTVSEENVTSDNEENIEDSHFEGKVLNAVDFISQVELQKLISIVHAGINKKGKVNFGKMGTFTAVAGAVRFYAGDVIRNSVEDTVLNTSDPFQKLFGVVKDAIPGTSVEAADFFRVGKYVTHSSTHRDYLGREYILGKDSCQWRCQVLLPKLINGRLPSREGVVELLKAPSKLPNGKKLIEQFETGKGKNAWNLLLKLENQVRDQAILPFAEEIVRRTMECARANLILLVERLQDAGYVFASKCPLGNPVDDADERLKQIEKEVGVLPLSLMAAYRVIGSFDLRGYHPDWNPSHVLHPRFESYKTPGFWETQPLVLFPLDEVSLEVNEKGGNLFVFAPHGFSLWGEEGASSTCAVLPNSDADFILFATGKSGAHSIFGNATLVSRMRQAFTYAGFPGMAYIPKRPKELIEKITQDLQAI